MIEKCSFLFNGSLKLDKSRWGVFNVWILHEKFFHIVFLIKYHNNTKYKFDCSCHTRTFNQQRLSFLFIFQLSDRLNDLYPHIPSLLIGARHSKRYFLVFLSILQCRTSLSNYFAPYSLSGRQWRLFRLSNGF